MIHCFGKEYLCEGGCYVNGILYNKGKRDKLKRILYRRVDKIINELVPR